MRFFFSKPKPETVIVSGLPRSGTSMLMRMLEAGGLPPLTDGQRSADDDNPRGYYEFEAVKQLRQGENAWLSQAQGKVVKVVSALLSYLPAGRSYRVIFLRRAMPEILASQREMLIRQGKDPDKVSDADLARYFEKHLQQVTQWLAEQPNMQVLYVDYNQALQDPRQPVAEINRFLGGGLDEARMRAVVEPALYRQRKGEAVEK